MLRTGGSLALIVTLLLAACGPRTEPFRTAERPETPVYASATPFGDTAFDNRDLAGLFVRLAMGMEGGGMRPRLQRFEGPVRVGMIGPGAQQYRSFLAELVQTIAREAEVPIALGPPPHQILVRLIPGEEFVPYTANQCFVLFGQPDWQSFKANPKRYNLSALKDDEAQTRVGVMIPDTIEPHKVRECLLEEVTQALGTANDLYGLGPTIFNDDNAHSWPTRLDYLMLRILYHPRMASGLSEEEAQARAYEILDEINADQGTRRALPEIRQESFKSIRSELFDIFAPGTSDETMRETLIELARKVRRDFPGSAYDCMIHSLLAGAGKDEDQTTLFGEAIRICEDVHGPDDIRIAELRLGQAYHDFDEDRYRRAFEEAEALIPVFLAHGKDDRLAAASILRLASAFKLDDPRWEDTFRDHAEAWSAYAFGDDNNVTSRLRN